MTKGKMMTDTRQSNAIEAKAMAKSRQRPVTTPSFGKLKLLASGSITAAAMILTLAPHQALAQAAPSPSGHSVNANPQLNSGNFTLGTGNFTPGPTSDTVTIPATRSLSIGIWSTSQAAERSISFRAIMVWFSAGMAAQTIPCSIALFQQTRRVVSASREMLRL